MPRAARIHALALAACLLLPARGAAQARRGGATTLAADLDSALSLIRRVHPCPFRRVSQAAFDSEAAALRASLPGLSEERAVAGMMHLVARLRDGHTTLLPSAAGGFDRWLPIRFYRFTDGVYVTAVDSSLRDLAGARVLRIGRLPATQALDSAGSLMGADNSLMRQEMGALLLSSPAALHALGIIPDSLGAELEVEPAGRPPRPPRPPRTVRLRAVPGTPDLTWRFWGEMFGPILDARDRYGDRYLTAVAGKRPLQYRTLDPAMPPHLRYRLYYDFTDLPGTRTTYVQINFMADDPRESFQAFRRRLWAHVDSAGSDRLVLDLRYNSGGNGELNLPFVHDIIRHETIDRAGHLYVLIGRKTFSAAVMLAAELARQTPATFVGEASGAGANHAGDPRTYTLPGTGMQLGVSTLYWQLGYPSDTLPYIPVSTVAPFSSSDYFDLRDPALEAILAGRARPLVAILREQGADSALQAYEERKARFHDLPWWRPFDARRMNHAGYELLAAGRLPEALAAFRMNTDAHPDDSGWWDSLGDGERAAADTASARQAYRRALALDPEAGDTRAKLDALDRR